MNFKKTGACLLAAAVGVGMCMSLSACGKKTKIVATTSDAAHTFNYWIQKAEGVGIGGEFDTYEQNPSVVWFTQKDWTYKSAIKSGDTYSQGAEVTNKIALHFEYPATGNEQNSFITSLASGSTDIFELDYAPETVTKMYDNGKLLDLTWYVKNYMPNYLKYITDNGLYNYLTTEIDGERRFLQLYNYNEFSNDYFAGYQYRRDWVLKYGVDPSQGQTTGQTFAEQHTDWGWTTVDGVKSWVDGIKFPSYYGYHYNTANNGKASGMGTLTYDADLKQYIDEVYPTYLDERFTGNDAEYRYEEYEGQWPVTLSDWEWMLDIFQIALDKLGYSNNGYCMSLFQSGFINTGNLVSSFGGGGVEWYKTPEGNVVFGGDTETFRTYIETMRQWYANGWIDEGFQSHSDLFWNWDENTVRQGYVGLFYGMDNQLLDGMDMSDGVQSNPTYGACSYGMSFPINDKYGSDDLKYKKPYCFYGLEQENNSIMIAKSAETNGKDIAGLCTFLDNMYTEEAAVVKNAGLSKEMLDQSQDAVKELFAKYGMEDGSWYKKDGHYYTNPKFEEVSTAVQMTIQPIRLFGHEGAVSPEKPIPAYVFRKELWNMFNNTGYLTKSFYNQLTPAQYDIYTSRNTAMRNNFTTEVPKFIKGSASMSDWDSWYKGLKKNNNIDSVTAMLDSLYQDLKG